MQVNSVGPGSGLQSEMNVTPLVDVVLVLLIIFMVVVPLLMQGYDVDVPRTSAVAAQEQVNEQVILSIDPTSCRLLDPPSGTEVPSDCRVSLGNGEIRAADLPVRLAAMLGGRPKDQRVLFLAANDGLNYEGVLRIVDLAKTGVNDLTIEVITAD